MVPQWFPTWNPKSNHHRSKIYVFVFISGVDFKSLLRAFLGPFGPSWRQNCRCVLVYIFTPLNKLKTSISLMRGVILLLRFPRVWCSLMFNTCFNQAIVETSDASNCPELELKSILIRYIVLFENATTKTYVFACVDPCMALCIP